MGKKSILSRLITILIMMFWLSTVNAAVDTKPAASLTFGITMVHMPYVSVSSEGYARGFGISFTEMVCKQMNVKCVYKAMIFSQLFPALENNLIDAAIGAISITPERQQHFNFTIPYAPSDAMFVGNAQSRLPKPVKMSNAFLAGKVIGVEKGSVFAEYIKKLYPSVVTKEYKVNRDVIEALSKQQVDYIALDILAAKYWVNESAGAFYLVGQPFNVGEGIGIMLNKNNLALQQALNNAIMMVKKNHRISKFIS